MPRCGKPPRELVHLLENALKDLPMTTQRLTFGVPAAYINGRMLAGLFNDKMILKLSPDDAVQMIGAAPFEPVAGRRMSGWYVVPPNIRDSARELNVWLGKAMDWTQRVHLTS